MKRAIILAVLVTALAGGVAAITIASPGGNHSAFVLCETSDGFLFFIEVFNLEHNEVGKAFGQAIAFCVKGGGTVVDKGKFHP